MPSLRNLMHSLDLDGRSSVTELARHRDLDERPFAVRELFSTSSRGAPAFSPATWQNWLGDLDSTAHRVRPDSRSEIVGAVQAALGMGGRIRAVGSGHSHSSAARPAHGVPNMFVDLSRYGGRLRQHDWLRRGVDRDRLVRLRAGTTIKRLNRLILPDLGRALANMGSFDGQTIAGAISTGTHGTGIQLATLADLVRSIEMVTVVRSATGRRRVQLFRIEPSDGITDPTRFGRAFDEHGMVLEQDDDLFHSVVVSYGCMGIATAYTLEVRDAYWLEEDSKLTSLRHVQGLLDGPPVPLGDGHEAPAFLPEDRHIQVLINTAQLGQDDVTCLIRRHSETDVQKKPSNWLQKWPPERRPNLPQMVVQSLVERIDLPAPDDDRPRLGDQLEVTFFEVASREKPFVRGRSETASYIALRRLRDGRAPDKAAKPPPRAISTDLAVPVMRTGDALRRLIRAIQDRNALFAVPIGIRFTAPSAHYLAASYGRYTGMLELPILVEAPRPPHKTEKQVEREVRRRLRLAKTELEAIERELRADAGLRVRPHLGKYTEIDRQGLEASFPRLDRWLDAYRRFNPFGLFDNEFTDQFDLSR